MMTSTNLCYTCKKSSGRTNCTGCDHYFCLKHFMEHRQDLTRQFEILVDEHDQLKDFLSIHREQSNALHPLMVQINQWEMKTIENVKQAANDAREQLKYNLNKNSQQISINLRSITSQLVQFKETEDYVETDLKDLQRKIEQLRSTCDKINEDLTIYLNTRESDRIQWTQLLRVETKYPFLPKLLDLRIDARWNPNGITILQELNEPWGITVDHDDETIFVADRWNHRIIARKGINGKIQVVAGGNGKGNGLHQLNYPTDILIDKETQSIVISDWGNRRVVRWSLDAGTNHGEVILDNIKCFGLAIHDDGVLYVSDAEKHQVRRYRKGDTTGIVVAGGNSNGSSLSQLDEPHSIVLDQECTLYVSDYKNHRIMKWMKGANQGILIAGGHGNGKLRSQLQSPEGIIVDAKGSIYVSEAGNDRVTRWRKGAKEGEIIVGGHGNGSQQFNGPTGLCFDSRSNLYVVDWGNNRVQRFSLT